MNATITRPLTDILADMDQTEPGTWAMTSLKNELEAAVRAQLAPLPEGEAEAMAAQAERAAQTMAPPVPGITTNGGYTVRAVIHVHPHQAGLLEAWVVAAEDAGRGAWVTWNAYALDHPGRIGQLAYDAGHYYDAVSGPSGLARADNRRRALADLAVRAGLTSGVALRIVDDVLSRTDPSAPWAGLDKDRTEDRRMARRLRSWAQR